MLRTADILAEHGYGLEYGSGRHGIGEPFFFSYVIEPRGNGWSFTVVATSTTNRIGSP